MQRQNRNRLKWQGGLAALVGLAMVCFCLADQPGAETRSISLQQLKPQWQLGDRWIVETRTQPVQTRRGIARQLAVRPIQWQFAVQRFEKTLDQDCYRVEVRCLMPGRPQPVTVLWVDRKSRALRKIQTQVPVPGGFRTMTENYHFAGGQPSPVLGPLSALPVDLPLLMGDQAKGMQKFVYETNTSPTGVKAVGDLGFAYEVEQQVAPAQPEQVKGLLSDTFSKDIGQRSTVEVQLKRFDRQVRQLWQPGLPWPVYTESGSTVSRLVKVIPAKSESEN